MLVQQMARRLHAQSSFEAAVGVILADAIALHGAEFGNVQLAAGDRLIIVLQQGFKAPFLEYFREVGVETGSACARALRTRQTVMVKDTETDEEFAPYRAVARAAGFRGILTTPLVSSDGSLIGTVSTHFVNVHEPTRIEIDALRSYSVLAADHLRELLGEESLETRALSMRRRLYEPLGAPDLVRS